MENFSKQYFGKDIDNLEYSDIEDYFNEEKEESDKIEFKSFHPEHGNFNRDIQNVIKAVCAFLNSSGGIVIWGAPLGVDKDNKKVFYKPLSPVLEYKEKDALISMISDAITPLPIGINVGILGKDEEFYLYVFEVQKSNYSPHQCDNTYYARLDGQTRKAPHYLIEALFKKVTYPNIEAYINLSKRGNVRGSIFYLDIEMFFLNFSEFINEENLRYRIICPEATTEPALASAGHTGYEIEGKIEMLHYGAPERNAKRLFLNADVLSDRFNNRINVILSWAGKNSPLKFSSYEIDIGRDSINGNLATCFISIEENELAIDGMKKKGTTRESLLNKILKR